jgi:transglutaminase-like putative cysteine protease
MSSLLLRGRVTMCACWQQLLLAGAAGFLLLASRSATEEKPRSPSLRTFAFTYAATVADLKPGQAARIWVPVPASSEEQEIEIVKKDLPSEGRIQTAQPYSNRMLYLEARADAKGEIPIALTYRVKRRELTRDKPIKGSEDTEQLARLLAANRLVPITGKPLELLDGKAVPTDEMEAARFLYDLVNRHLRYSKEGTGWGRGDSVWACENGRGNCTDFHSLFLSLVRARHIPAQLEMGFLLPPEHGSGTIAGYHCWAKFRLSSGAWLPVDISEANKEPHRRDYYFGNLSADRVAFSAGRDLTLRPRQAGSPVNFFIYPYVEVEGKEHPQTKIRRRFTFRDE